MSNAARTCSRPLSVACRASRRLRLRHTARARHLAGPASALEGSAARDHRGAHAFGARPPRRNRGALQIDRRRRLHAGHRGWHFPPRRRAAFPRDLERPSGFFVYTPLELADGRFVFVNRGFVPYDLKDAAKRPQGQVEGEVTVTGLARNPLPAKPSSLVPGQRSRARTSSTGRTATRWRRAPGLRHGRDRPGLHRRRCDAKSRRLPASAASR